jgi:hypothetical protein
MPETPPAANHTLRLASLNVESLDHCSSKGVNQLFNVAQSIYVSGAHIVALQVGYSVVCGDGRISA